MIGNTHGFASPKPGKFSAHLKKGRQDDPHKYVYTGRATESRGYHRAAGCSSAEVSATLEEQGNDGFTMSTQDPNSAMKVSVRWSEQSGQTELIVSNSTPDDEYRVEQRVTLPEEVWNEKDWQTFADTQLKDHTWYDGHTPFEALERPLIAGEGIKKVQLTSAQDGFSIQVDDNDQYLIAHGVTHLSDGQKDLSLQPRKTEESQTFEQPANKVSQKPLAAEPPQ